LYSCITFSKDNIQSAFSSYSSLAAFNDITADDTGQEALKEQLNRVHITNSGQFFSGQSAYKMKDGTLTIDHQGFANQAEVGLRHEALRNLLETSL